MAHSLKFYSISWATRFLAVLFFLSLSSTAPASLIEEYCSKSYLGVDAALRYMTWKKGYGDNVFRRSGWQPNVYAGLQLNPYLGFEVGYESLNNKQRSTIITGTPPLIVLGNPLDDDLVSINSSVKLHGWHFNATGTYPLSCGSIELLGTVGFAYLKTTQQFIFVGGQNGLLPRGTLVATFSKSKLVPRLSFGTQYKITENLKLRIIFLGIENTSALGDLGQAKEAGTGPYPDDVKNFRVKMKYHTYHSLGIVFNF